MSRGRETSVGYSHIGKIFQRPGYSPYFSPYAVYTSGRSKSPSQPSAPITLVGGNKLFRICDHAYSHCSFDATSIPKSVHVSQSDGYTKDWRYENKVVASSPPLAELGLISTSGNGLAIHPGCFGDSNALVVKAYSKARNNVIELGEGLAELKRTTSFIADTAFDFAQSILAIKRGKLGELKRIFGHVPRSKNLAGRWLEYNYAVKPLVGDIESLLEIHEKQLRAALIIRALAGSGDTHDLSTPAPSYYNAFTSAMQWTSRVRSKTLVGLYLRVTDTEKYGRSAFGLDSGLLTAWNLLPLSFVADWGVKIGEFLEAQSAQSLTDFVNGFVVNRIEGTSSAIPQASDASWSRSESGAFTSTGYSVTPITSDPGLVAPRINNPWSSSHGLTTAALLRQLPLGKYK